MVRPKKTDKPAREKILETASDLFYRQGYFQTGVNQIIDEAGVSKATFYAHYPTKEDLSLEHLRMRIEHDYREITKVVRSYETPRDRFMAFIKLMEPFMVESDYRGCAFANLASEITDHENPMLPVILEHEEQFMGQIRSATKDLLESDSETYGDLDLEEVTQTYYIIIEGAIAAAHNLRQIWPVLRAIAFVEKWIP